MPLLDHFHAPVHPRYPWESFHTFWAAALGEHLNRLLPRRYFAVIHTHFGSQVEADVAELERVDEPHEEEVNGPGGVAVQTYAPPAVALTLPAVYPDDLEVQVLDQRDGARLVAVVELISPRNKDRPEARRGFAAKCVAYLERGIGVVTVDIVTSHHFNLHNELVRVLGLGEEFAMPATAFLSAVAYRPARREGRNEIDVWPAGLAVGGALPMLPLALLGARAVPLDLETTYNEARQRSRL
jgi:hypothetical protein